MEEIEIEKKADEDWLIFASKKPLEAMRSLSAVTAAAKTE